MDRSQLSFPYSDEYHASDSFWASRPAKYVRLFSDDYPELVSNARVIDIGAGEGKNAVHLAKREPRIVMAVDTSYLALSRFSNQPGFHTVKSRIMRVAMDATKMPFDRQRWDVAVAYGYFHCLASLDQIRSELSRLKTAISEQGSLIVAAFTDKISVPESQPYLRPEALAPSGFYRQMFSDWKIERYEEDIITERHPTGGDWHQHSICRLLARKL